MSSQLFYNPGMLINTLLIPPPRNALNQHYLLYTLKKHLQPIRNMFDHQSGADFIQMLQLRQGFNRSIDVRDKVIDQILQICFYRPQGYSLKKKIVINGAQYQVDGQIQPIKDLDQIYWIFIIEGQIFYKNQIHKSGSSLFLQLQFMQTFKEVKDKSFSSKTNSIMAVFHTEKLIKMKKLMYLRERKRKIDFLATTPFKYIGQKKLINFFNQITSLNLKVSQKVIDRLDTKYIKQLKIMQENKQFHGVYDNSDEQNENYAINPEINQQIQLSKSKVENNFKSPSHVFIVYKGQITIKAISKNFGQSSTEIKKLTKGSIFGTLQTLQILKWSQRIDQIRLRDTQPNQSLNNNQKTETIFSELQDTEQIKIFQLQKGSCKTMHKLCFQAAQKIDPTTATEKLKLKKFFYGQIKNYEFISTSMESLVLAIPTEKIIQFSQNNPLLRKKIIKKMKQTLKYAKQLMECKSERKIQEINRQTLFNLRKKQNQATHIEQRVKTANCLTIISKMRSHFLTPEKQVKKRVMHNLIKNSLLQKHKQKSTQNLKQASEFVQSNFFNFGQHNTIKTQDYDNKQFNIQDIHKTLAKQTIKSMPIKKDVSHILKNRAKTTQGFRRNQNIRSQSSPIINSSFKKFFIPQQFCSRKLKINYEFMLNKMRKNQDQMTPTGISDLTKKSRDYVSQFINDKRIVKKFPKRKFLPIYNQAKHKAQKKEKQQRQIEKLKQKNEKNKKNLSIQQRIAQHNKTISCLSDFTTI